MTFFLNEAPPPTIKARGPDILPTTDLEGIGAAFSKAQLENDSNGRLGREIVNVERDRVQKAFGIVGPDEILKRMKQEGLAPDTLEVMRPELLDNNKQGRDLVLDMARGKLSDGTGPSFSGVDLSQEGIDKEVNAKLQAEHQDQEDILAMMPSGRALAELLGGIAGITADVKNLPFLLLGGGGGSVLKILGREAAINMAAEATFMPSQFEMAKRLDIPDPNVIQNLALAGIGGAAFAAVPLAISRGIHYAKGRNIAKLPNIDADRSEIIVSAAEDAFVRGEDPFAAMDAVEKQLPKAQPPVEPLITKEHLPPVEGQTPDVIPADEMTAQADAAIGEAEAQFAKDFPEMRHKYPLGRLIQRLGGVRAKIKNANGDMVASPLAEELAAMGVTQRTHPFMFRKDGMTNLDNIPANEHAGLAETIGTDHQTGYFDAQGLTSALGRELSTGDKHPLSGDILHRTKELQNLRSPDAGPSRDETGPVQDFLAGKKAPDGFHVNPERYDFLGDGGRQLEQHFDEWATERGYDQILTPKERTEILQELQTRGGDADYLVERVLERDQNYAERPENSPTGNADAAGGNGIDEAFPIPGETTGGGAGQGGRGIDAATERTAAGEQYVTPGVEPITERQRLEAQQAKPIGGGPWVPDSQIGGLFDPNDKVRLDMFSDPASSEARVVQDAVSADFRDQIAKDGDFKVDLGDGKGARPASEVLADLDQGDIFSARLDLCGKGPA